MNIPLLKMIVRLVLIVRITNAVIGWIMRRTNAGVGRVMRRPSNRRGWMAIAVLAIIAYVLSQWERLSEQTSGGSHPATQRAASQRPFSNEPEQAVSGNGSTQDLTMIEGIGPKIAAALSAAGIDTFDKLARATEPELRTALASAGLRFTPSLSTWSQQAEYAARGDWDTLKTYQQALTAGRS